MAYTMAELGSMGGSQTLAKVKDILTHDPRALELMKRLGRELQEWPEELEPFWNKYPNPAQLVAECVVAVFDDVNPSADEAAWRAVQKCREIGVVEVGTKNSYSARCHQESLDMWQYVFESDIRLLAIAYVEYL